MQHLSVQGMTYTEEEIIIGCQKGHGAAQEALYKTYASKMRYICIRYASSTMEVDDIFQEAFIKIFNNIKNYKGDGSFEGWIRRIFVNTAIDSFKKDQKKLSRPLLDYDTHDKSETEHEESFESFAESLSKDEVLEIITQLPDGYKMVFNLYAIENYSHKEIASMLNITEGTSKSQLSKARSLLRKQVKEYALQNNHKIKDIKFGVNRDILGARPA
jgi:RNA polymerase sigma-70 factor (ECF subfamily)